LLKLLKAGKIDKKERVVVISTAHGLKFVEMKVKYHQKELEFPSRYANQPLELPATLEAVKGALRKVEGRDQKGRRSKVEGRKKAEGRNPNLA
jgi:threonine synthase